MKTVFPINFSKLGRHNETVNPSGIPSYLLINKLDNAPSFGGPADAFAVGRIVRAWYTEAKEWMGRWGIR